MLKLIRDNLSNSNAGAPKLILVLSLVVTPILIEAVGDEDYALRMLIPTITGYFDLLCRSTDNRIWVDYAYNGFPGTAYYLSTPWCTNGSALVIGVQEVMYSTLETSTLMARLIGFAPHQMGSGGSTDHPMDGVVPVMTTTLLMHQARSVGSVDIS